MVTNRGGGVRCEKMDTDSFFGAADAAGRSDENCYYFVHSGFDLQSRKKNKEHQGSIENFNVRDIGGSVRAEIDR